MVSSLVERSTARIVGPGPDGLEILERLCREAGATGKLVTDAQHAAITVEHGCTLVSTDSDFNRFAGIRWHHPLRPDSMQVGRMRRARRIDLEDRTKFRAVGRCQVLRPDVAERDTIAANRAIWAGRVHAGHDFGNVSSAA